MNREEKFGKLLEAFKNNTKLSIIFLLADNGRMTVTQMSEHVDISRTNLYHFVSQLVEDEILNQPEIVPKKNYLEKYYTLNEELFSETQYEELKQHFESMTVDDVRSLLSEILIAQSFNLQLLAEKIKKSNDEQMEKIKGSMLNLTAYIGYSVSHIGGHPDYREILEKVDEEFSKPNPVKSERKDDLVRSLIIVLPYL